MNDPTVPQTVLFPDLFDRPLTATFDQVHASSDGGAILLKSGGSPARPDDGRGGRVDGCARRGARDPSAERPRGATHLRPGVRVPRRQ